MLLSRCLICARSRRAALAGALMVSCGGALVSQTNQATHDAPPSSSTPTRAAETAVATHPVALGAAIELPDGTSLVVEDIMIEHIEPAPDDLAAYPGGSGATVRITVRGEVVTLTKLPAGYDGSPVAWLDDLKIELHDTDGKVAQLSVHRITSRALATERVRVQRGERVRLHDMVDFTFVSHSHKSVGPGQESPLMVNVDYHDGHPYPRTHSLFLPGEASWAWQDLRFTLAEHQYDEFMVLTVDRLALERLLPP